MTGKRRGRGRAATTVAPFAEWSASELERRARAEGGTTVLASMRRDHDLIAWAESTGRFVRIDRRAYPLGNPLRLDDDHDRDAVIAWYRVHWLPFVAGSIDWVSLSEGKVLGCWCYPEPCHGGVLLEEIHNHLEER